ncbi:MAG: exodeoxyribonuclease subunit beta, partial [Rhizobacter sp.]|nr:exodeoxyribonuclease subunit beta [Rhizobacter sp.]
LRLLYVALTRARHALWVGVAALKDRGSACVLHRSALGSLLTGGQVVAGDQLPAVLEQAFGQTRADLVDAGGDAAALDVVLLAAPPETPVTRLRRRESEGALHDAPAYDGRFERHWAIGSFSALVRDIAAPSIQHVMGEAVREEELLGAPQEAPVPARADAPWHRFPRGALPGNFLHDQLEWLSGEDFALADSPALQEQLRRRCEREGWGHRADDVVAWLRAVVGTELPPVGVSLDSVTHRLAEMEFWFPSDGLASAEVDALCRQHLLGERPRPALPARQLRGMLMGFADLVFEHEGRYWVLDYKSNALGSRDADYHRGALESAMAEHRYDV